MCSAEFSLASRQGVPEHIARRLARGEHPAAGEGLWGTQQEAPSFLYAMPLPGGRMFLEETCLVAKPTLPFAALKRRLHRRLAAMGVQVSLMTTLGFLGWP